MPNTDLKKSFEPIDPGLYRPQEYLCDASFAAKAGDVVYLDSAGRVTDTASGVALGIQVSAIYSVATLQVETTGSSTAEESAVLVISDPNVRFRGQISTFTQTDPYTTRSSAGCYDVAGSAGAQYVDAAASTNDTIKVIERSHEYEKGGKSEVGAFAKCEFAFNQLKHAYGVIA